MTARDSERWTAVRGDWCPCGGEDCARRLVSIARQRDVLVDAQESLFDDPARPATDPALGEIEGLLTWRVAAA